VCKFAHPLGIDLRNRLGKNLVHAEVPFDSRAKKGSTCRRDRNAIYKYLSAVYDLLAWWTADGRETERSRRALRLQRLEVSDREEPFAAIMRCTADPAKADKRTRSK
jgi:hypothetical protein